MNTITQGALAPSSLVSIIGGQAKTNSLVVAEKFGKQHKSVLRTVSKLECSQEFTERNFALSEYIDSTGRKLPYYA